MDERSDQQLLREYAGRGSESAFTELVKRHTSLVYGTALRKLTDASQAEEITQAVFVILARKAAFLCHRENIAAWLHQTTLLECRHHLRTELRRRRREQTAMEMNTPQTEPALAHELDDALLELSDKDRQPLLLRFFESLNLREVGARLGTSEDTAQKRVTKSLSLLERILRRRGRDITSVALTTALANSAQAAPTYLAASAAQAALTTAGTASAIGLAFGKFMALSKPQLMTACILAVGAPLLLEAQQLQAARAEARAAQTTLAFHQNKSTQYSEAIRTIQSHLSTLEVEQNAIAVGIQQVQNGTAPRPLPSRAVLYRWSDASPYVRLPKELLDGIRLTAVRQSAQERSFGKLSPVSEEIERLNPIDSKGVMSEALIEALALTEEERAGVSTTLQQLGARFDSIAAQRTSVTNIMPPGISFPVPDGYQLRTLVTHEFPEEGKQMKEQLIAAFEKALGQERAEILMRQGHSALTHSFQDFGARQKWLSAAPAQNGMVTIGRAQTSDGTPIGSSVSTVKPAEVPESLRAFLPQSLFVNHE